MKLSDQRNKYSTTSELFDVNTEIDILVHVQEEIGNITSACFRFINTKNPLFTEQEYLSILSSLGSLNTTIEETIPDMRILALRHPSEKSANFTNIKYNRTKLMDIVRRLNVLFEIEKDQDAFSREYIDDRDDVLQENNNIVSFLDYYQAQTGEVSTPPRVQEKRPPLSSLIFAQALNEQKLYESFLEEMQAIGTKSDFFAQLQRPYHDLNEALGSNDPRVEECIKECSQVRAKFEDIFKISLAARKTPIPLEKSSRDEHLVLARSNQTITPDTAKKIREELFAIQHDIRVVQDTLEQTTQHEEGAAPVLKGYFHYARRALLATLGATMGAAFAYGPAKDFTNTPKVPLRKEDAIVQKNTPNPHKQEQSSHGPVTVQRQERASDTGAIASQKVLMHMLHQMTDTHPLRSVHIGSYAQDGHVYVPFTLEEMKEKNPSFAKDIALARQVQVVGIYKTGDTLRYVEGTEYGNGHWSVKPESFAPITVAMKVVKKDGSELYYGVGSMHTPRLSVPEMKQESPVLFNEYIAHGVDTAKATVEAKDSFIPPKIVDRAVSAAPLHKTIEEGVHNAQGEEVPKGLWGKTKNLLGNAAKKVGSFWK